MPVSWVIFSVSVPFLFPEITCSVLWWKAHIHSEEHRDTGDTPVRDMKSCPSYSKAIPGQHQPRRLGRTHDPESAGAALGYCIGQDWQEDRIRSFVLCLCVSTCFTWCYFQAVHTGMFVHLCACWEHVLSVIAGWAWGCGAAAFSPLWSYWFWQIVI